MIRRVLLLNLILLKVILAGNFLIYGMELSEDNVLIPDKASGSIKIDGELEEAVWQQAPLDKPFITLLPTYGQELSRKTWVWAAYDKKNLYFAFKCFDTEPDKVKTSISQRDKVSRDDYVGILLDGVGTRQSAYEFYVNPHGIQADAINSAVSGTDYTPDFVWHSAGKRTPDGYQVEVRIPLETIRYKSGKQVKMGIIFMRQIPHLGALASWPAIEPWQVSLKFMVPIVYKGFKTGLKLEILPNFTYSRDSDRSSADTWDKSTDTNIGATLKYGISSSMTAEAAVNPDFSQVESDAFQVEVNRRYPIFYSEKRPFFMESKDVLDFSTVLHGMMISAIHTRRIADPGWALKFSGSSGKLNFALLGANDRAPGRAWEQGVNPNEGKNALFGILRAKYNLGSDNTFGILYSGRHFGDQQNDVLGMDLNYRLSKYIRASVSYLHSATREAEDDPLEKGSGFNAMVMNISPRLISWAIYERYSTDFFMATAFQNRVGISRGGFGVGPIINVNCKKLPWLKRILPFVHIFRLYDLGTEMKDTTREYAVNFGFSPQGELNLEYWHEDEAWAGKLLDKKFFHSVGWIQLVKWLFIFEDVTIGEQIYYHPSEPFVGNGKIINFGFTLEPSLKLKIGFDYWHSDLKEKQGNQKIYSVDIYNLSTTYQFNKYFFMRANLRYDSLQEKLLTDLLASFTLIPGTVVHLGYGSLHLRNRWQDNQWIPGEGDLLKMKQGLFFKASYLWRLK